MRLHNQEKNNLAIYTGIRKASLSKFVRKYNLDIDKLTKNVMKYKNVRKDLVAAVSGYDENPLAQEFIDKYSLDEGRRADEFFTTKHGKAIFNLLKRNGKEFSKDLISQYFDKLNIDDYRWAKIMDRVCFELGLNYANYNTYAEQEVDMINAIEKLYREYSPSNKNTIVSKKTIDEMLDRALKIDTEEEVERRALKRIVIDVGQFEALLNMLINMNSKPVNIQEGTLDDTYTFEVYSSRSKTFLDYVKTLPTISMKNMKRDNHYWYITLTNSGRFEEWEPVVKFYKENIKI
jgi:hypothetical protein